ncbi:IucA/IucC family protein [Aureimonas flava]|uniref:IucA/IucC family protein n=1 Tax=Aureimonas flava TaxID=2320271 RepID=A0A3A1WGC7_9HYPH|nr:IucA/IucC family protein [Aureimonas flava]RIX98472.1 IucA/IucC family protein [Aureimonas flava]
MSHDVQAAAEAAAFRSFANVYLREIDPGIAVRHAQADGPPAACLEWALHRQRVRVRAELASASLCGAHRFGRVWLRNLHEPRWRIAAPLAAVQLLLGEAFERAEGPGPGTASARERELALLGRILDSYRETARQLALADRADHAEAADASFIAAERSLVFGHWLHPTPKSRHGMTGWQARRYGAEEGGTFQLVAFAGAASRVRQASAAPLPASRIALDLLGTSAAGIGLRADEVLLPLHPLQAEALLLEPHVEAALASGALRLLGPQGRRFAATSSLRTVYAPNAAWMAKFSLPVTLTNSLRVNRTAELEAGVAMARLANRLDFAAAFPGFRILADPACLAFAWPDREEGGFETVLRENPFRGGAERGVATVAALAAEPPPGRRSRLEGLIRRLGAADGEPAAAVARRWFGRYLDCMLEPVAAMFDRHGIALEAHQQNALVDVSAGWPTRGFYRDNQGFYLAESARETLLALAPETARIPGLFFDDREVRRRLGYYLVVNQIFSVVSRLAHDGLAGEHEMLDGLAARLERIAAGAGPRGRAFARAILEEPTLCTKANLRVRLLGRDELASAGDAGIYMDYPNPIARLRAPARDALAS